ncbi:MAG TPA: DUF481 domain-containing protein [Caldithrix abyssi]|uniref:DUF481 domain-containing protein n=1 Tax=Caldithrix abyssi TaxID=187145 RepID=A0A7V4U1Z3_CALAY|nr:DUF481 domain-containing protein [Caldithrix abyssi]
MRAPSYKITNQSFLTLLIFHFLLLLPILLKAQKTDIVILDNGDRLTGEIKWMEQAVLKFNTDAMSYIDIKWKKIVYLKTTNSFRVENSDGSLFFGMLETDSLKKELIVGIGSKANRVDMDDVVEISEVKDTFRKGLNLSVDLGFTYTKASDIVQFNLSGDGGYSTLYWDRNFSFRSVLTLQNDTSFTKNQNVKVTLYRLLPNKYFLTGFAGATQNTELGLKMRLSFGGGGGRHLLRTNNSILRAAIGLQGTREWQYGTSEVKNNLESVFAAGYEKFMLFTPKLNINISIQAYPNLTETGRYRIDFDAKIKWELIKDLFWGITFYDNFDSKPPQESSGEGQNDYGITLSLGWKY